jgi:sec-independent protein translocase protein TatC
VLRRGPQAPQPVDEPRMSIIEHLEALRRALIIVVVAWGVATIAAWFVSGPVINLLIDRAGVGKTIYLQPAGGFLTELKVALYLGLVLSSPVVIQQIWWFVSPGLFKHERRFALPMILATIFFFALGVAAAIFALPLYLKVLNGISPKNVVYLPDIGELIGFILTMVLGFGIVFELPVVLFVLGMLRIINSRWLYKNRPWWFLALGLLSNFLTPGADPLTPLIMFVPLYIFYEATALILKLSGR